MRITTFLAYTTLSLVLMGCSGIDIDPSNTDQFKAGNYRYYKWRTEPLPSQTRSSDPVYIVDPVVRREVDAGLQGKGYLLDPQRAQFTVDYVFATGMVQGERSDLASNISPYPSATPNRQANPAIVDNAIALSGVKETNNLVVQFNDKKSNREVWQVTLSKIVEDINNADKARVDNILKEYLKSALQSLPQASVQ